MALIKQIKEEEKPPSPLHKGSPFEQRVAVTDVEERRRPSSGPYSMGPVPIIDALDPDVRTGTSASNAAQTGKATGSTLPSAAVPDTQSAGPRAQKSTAQTVLDWLRALPLKGQTVSGHPAVQAEQEYTPDTSPSPYSMGDVPVVDALDPDVGTHSYTNPAQPAYVGGFRSAERDQGKWTGSTYQQKQAEVQRIKAQEALPSSTVSVRVTDAAPQDSGIVQENAMRLQRENDRLQHAAQAAEAGIPVGDAHLGEGAGEAALAEAARYRSQIAQNMKTLARLLKVGQWDIAREKEEEEQAGVAAEYSAIWVDGQIEALQKEREELWAQIQVLMRDENSVQQLEALSQKDDALHGEIQYLKAQKAALEMDQYDRPRRTELLDDLAGAGLASDEEVKTDYTSGEAMRVARLVWSERTGNYKNRQDQDDDFLSFMTPREKNALLYYAQAGDESQLESFYEKLRRDLTARNWQAQAEEMTDDNAGAADKMVRVVYPVFANQVKPVAYVENIGQFIKNMITGKDERPDINTGAIGMARLGNTVQEKVLENATPFGRFIGNAAYGITSSAPIYALGPIGALIYASASAAGDTTVDALERGATSGQAFAMGTVAGVAEAVLEKMPMDELFDLAKSGSKELRPAVAAMFKQTGMGAAEESITQYVDTLNDILIMGPKSKFEQYKADLMDRGFSAEDADEKAKMEFFIKQPLEAGATGGVTGAAQAAAANTIAQRYDNNTTRQIGNKIIEANGQDSLIAAGLEMPKNSDAYIAAQSLHTRRQAGEKISNLELGKLQNKLPAKKETGAGQGGAQAGQTQTAPDDAGNATAQTKQTQTAPNDTADARTQSGQTKAAANSIPDTRTQTGRAKAAPDNLTGADNARTNAPDMHSRVVNAVAQKGTPDVRQLQKMVQDGLRRLTQADAGGRNSVASNHAGAARGYGAEDGGTAAEGGTADSGRSAGWQTKQTGDTRYRFQAVPETAQTKNANAAASMLQARGIEAVVIDGDIITEKGGRTDAKRVDAVTLPGGQVLIRNGTDMDAAQIMSREGIHTMSKTAPEIFQGIGRALESSGLDIAGAQDVLRTISDGYGAPGPGTGDAGNPARVYEDVAAGIAGMHAMDPRLARETFSGVMNDYDAALQAILYASDLFDETLPGGLYGGQNALAQTGPMRDNGNEKTGGPAAFDSRAEGAGETAGIPKVKIDEILKTPKGSRPDPITYLSTEYTQNHLSKFNNGVTKIVAQAPTGTAGPPTGTFVMPASIADYIIAQAGGNVSKLEQLLGLPQGSLGTNPVRIDIANPTGLRLPNGNELGANSQWIPGGYTSGGLLEAIIDSPKIGQYIIIPIK